MSRTRAAAISPSRSGSRISIFPRRPPRRRHPRRVPPRFFRTTMRTVPIPRRLPQHAFGRRRSRERSRSGTSSARRSGTALSSFPTTWKADRRAGPTIRPIRTARISGDWRAGGTTAGAMPGTSSSIPGSRPRRFSRRPSASSDTTMRSSPSTTGTTSTIATTRRSSRTAASSRSRPTVGARGRRSGPFRDTPMSSTTSAETRSRTMRPTRTTAASGMSSCPPCSI